MLPLPAALEGQRLFGEHGFRHNLAGRLGVETVRGNEVAAIGNDRVGVLHDLQPLDLGGAREPHADADDLQNVDDAKRPVPLVRA